MTAYLEEPYPLFSCASDLLPAYHHRLLQSRGNKICFCVTAPIEINRFATDAYLGLVCYYILSVKTVISLCKGLFTYTEDQDTDYAKDDLLV